MIVPFWSYFFSRTLDDLTDVVGQARVFLPLGAHGRRAWRQSFLTVVLIGFGCGVLAEIGQVFLPDRTVDVSDAISATAGTGVGWALWRWGELPQIVDGGDAIPGGPPGRVPKWAKKLMAAWACKPLVAHRSQRRTHIPMSTIISLLMCS